MTLQTWVDLLVFWLKLGLGGVVCLFLLFLLMVAIASLDRVASRGERW